MSAYSTIRLLELRQTQEHNAIINEVPDFPKINPEVKALWIEALREPDRKQGDRSLQNADGAQCCLGVLCELHAKSHPNVVIASYANAITYDGEMALPNKDVLAWAGIDNDYRFKIGQVGLLRGLDNSSYEMRMMYVFTYLNDRARLSFNQIADFIETNL